ncbi:MAG: nicotinate-nucleotide diphosphorylase (carboxylating), partial [Psychrobacter sp.]|nr:nicotinate-nucleotide diphosphorylase (carboxylating) [Psychrobacter sp.]
MTVKQEPALAEVLLKPLVEAALTEDLGRRGDVTSQATIPADMQAQLQIKARQAGVICGMDLARLSFALIDGQTEFMAQVNDGEMVEAGAVLAIVRGNARNLLTAERTALNFMTHLSGIATDTKKIADSVAEYPAQ